MPRRKAGWVPALTHRKRDGRGRVRIPGRGDVYLGAPGCWPAEQRDPPPDVVRAWQAEVAEWLGRAPTAPETGGSVSCGELMGAYLAHAEVYYRKGGKPTSELSLLKQALRQVRLRYGRESADDLTPARLVAIQEGMAAAGMCRRTCNAFVSRIRRVWKWGVKRGLVAPGVWHALLAVEGLPQGRGMAKERPPVAPVPVEWIEPTAAMLPPSAAVALRVQLLAGMRPLEVCDLRLSRLDRSGRTWVYRPGEAGNKLAHKGRDRVVFLGPQARKLLSPLVRAAERAGRDHLFATSTGSRLTPAHYGALVREAAVAGGLPSWSPNRLRHNALTDARRKHGLEGAQAVGGHSEVKTTQVYAERSEELARKIAEEMG